MAWIPAAISAGGSILGGLAGGGGSEHYGPSENIWKPFRQPLEDLGLSFMDLYNQNPSGTNANMDAGIQGMANMGQTMQPFVDYGMGMMGSGVGALGNLNQIGQNYMNYDPTSYNSQYQNGQATVGGMDQGAFNQSFGNYASAIQPMLQSIGQMNANAYNRQALPGVASQAIMSGNTGGDKWGMNNALKFGEMAQANAGAAGQMYGQGAQQANQIGAQFGSQNLSALNSMAQLNTQLGNQLRFQQSGRNAELGLQALQGAGDLYGNMLAQGNSYFSPTASLLQQIPQYQYQAGQAELNAPLNWRGSIFDYLAKAGQGGGAGSTFGPTQTSPWPAVIGEVADAGIGWYDSTRTKEG